MSRATVKKANKVLYTDTVDQLGLLKSRISALQEQERELRDQLVTSGLEEIDGSTFRATVSNSAFRQVNYPALIDYLQPSARVLAKYTETKERTTVRVVARQTS